MEARTAKRPRSRQMQRRDWVVAARKLLISRGISNVKVEPLAKALRMTTGSFYWHFSGRKELHDALLQDWYDTNTAPLFDAVKAAGSDPRHQYLAFFGVWVLERDFDPEYDRAIRDWARTAKSVAKTLRDIDDRRIQLLLQIFENFGYSGLEAAMRARITYYHQVGYYALGEREAQDRRLELAPYYAEVLTGMPWMRSLATIDEIRAGMRGERSFDDEWPGRVAAKPDP